MTVEPDIVDPEVERLLRQTLRLHAESVRPTANGWAAITDRIDRRRQRGRVVIFALAAVLPVLAVGATLVVAGGTDSRRQVDTAGSGPASSPSTTVAPEAAAPVAPSTTAAMRSTTTTPRGPAAAATARATGMIWPETQADFDEMQASVDQGHQPWLGSPAEMAKLFLRDRGLPNPEVTDIGGAARSKVTLPYVAGGVSGTVSLAQARDGGLYYVTGSTTDRLARVDLSRRGSVVTVDFESSAAGTVSARLKRPGGDWGSPVSKDVGAGDSGRLEVTGAGTGDVILQVRHEGSDGSVGIADQFVAAKSSSSETPAEVLSVSSKLRVDGLGPVKVGMTLAEAEAAAGIPMTRRVGPFCTELVPSAGISGVAFVATDGSDRVDVVVVTEPGVVTADGVGVGAALGTVQEAVTSVESLVVGNAGRLVQHSGDFELVFGIGDGNVTYLWAGHAGLSQRDELCA